MPDDQPNEPLIPVRAVPKTQPQQPKKPQPQQRSPDDVNDFRDQIRRAITNIEASASIQDDTITQLSNDVHEVLDAHKATDKAILAELAANREHTLKVLEATQQMHRQMITKLNERQVSRAWPAHRIAILAVAATVVAFGWLVWHG